jgi:hypothetical protein
MDAPSEDLPGLGRICVKIVVVQRERPPMSIIWKSNVGGDSCSNPSASFPPVPRHGTVFPLLSYGHLTEGRWQRKRQQGGDDRQAGAWTIGTQCLRHAPHGLRHDRDRHDFQAMHGAGVRQFAILSDAIGKGDECQGRWHREPDPRSERAEPASTGKARSPCRPGCLPGLGETGRARPNPRSCARPSSDAARQTRCGSSQGGRPVHRTK